MEVDMDTRLNVDLTKQSSDGNTPKSVDVTNGTAKGVSFSKSEAIVSATELYPIFWSLQQYFNQPKKLFDSANLAAFKSGLAATMTMFISVKPEEPRAKPTDEPKKETKRKRSSDDLANSFNPKYLTSIDLFELEVCPRPNSAIRWLTIVDTRSVISEEYYGSGVDCCRLFAFLELKSEGKTGQVTA